MAAQSEHKPVRQLQRRLRVRSQSLLHEDVIGGQVELSICCKQPAVIIKHQRRQEMLSQRVAGSDHAVLVTRRFGERLRRCFEFGPVCRRLHIRPLQQILSIVPDPDIDCPRKRHVVIIVFQNIDCIDQSRDRS
jgi:hypothetical protein